MKKYVISIITLFLLCLILSNAFCEVKAVGIGTVVDDPDNYISDPGGDNTALVNIGNIIVGLVKAVGISLSILMLTIIGIKYITGSVQERAEYKQTIWPYIIGALLIFAGAELTQIIYDALN